jgi:hypothetical protein
MRSVLIRGAGAEAGAAAVSTGAGGGVETVGEAQPARHAIPRNAAARNTIAFLLTPANGPKSHRFIAAIYPI